MATRSVSSVRLDSRDEGSGSGVVLVHGMGEDHTVWNLVIPRLASSHRIVAPDLRGHGRSGAPAEAAYSLAEFDLDLRELVRDKRLPTAHWVGFSGGAFLALRMALDHPELVRSLTLVCGASYVDAHTRSVIERWWATYAKEGPDAFALRLLKDLYYPDWIEGHLEVADQLREVAKHRNYGPAVAWSRQLFSFDEKSRIAGLRIPTLMVQAMDDAVVDASHGRILRQTIPGAQIRILPQTGHMVPTERPAELAEAVSALFDRAEVDAPPTRG